MTPMLGFVSLFGPHMLSRNHLAPLIHCFKNQAFLLTKTFLFVRVFLTRRYRNSEAKCWPNSLLSSPPTPFHLGLVPSVAKAMRSHATLTLHLGNAKSHSNLQYRNLSPATGKQAKPLGARTFLVT